MAESAKRTGELLAILEQRGLYLAVAESITGGALTAALTSIAGSSKVVLGGVVAYQTSLKHKLLGVSQQLLQTNGAVDPEVALQMAVGVRSKLAKATGTAEAQVVGVATTGVAGPTIQDGKAVGTVFVAIAGFLDSQEFQVVSAHMLTGTRQEVQSEAVKTAINQLREHFLAN